MKAVKTSVSLVLVGQFNPDDFLPKMLSKGKVIAEKSAENATFITLISKQNVHFSLDWAEISVFRDRFQITSLEAPHIRICDLAVKAISELAPKSTVSQFGINLESHYQFESAQKRNDLGVKLAPPEIWGSWGKKIRESIEGENCGTPMQGGLLSIQMRLPFSENGVFGWRDVIVGASQETNGGPSVLFRANHHHQATPLTVGDANTEDPKPDANSTGLLLDALSKSFDQSLEDSNAIFEEVIAAS